MKRRRYTSQSERAKKRRREISYTVYGTKKKRAQKKIEHTRKKKSPQDMLQLNGVRVYILYDLLPKEKKSNERKKYTATIVCLRNCFDTILIDLKHYFIKIKYVYIVAVAAVFVVVVVDVVVVCLCLCVFLIK